MSTQILTKKILNSTIYSVNIDENSKNYKAFLREFNSLISPKIKPFKLTIDTKEFGKTTIGLANWSSIEEFIEFYQDEDLYAAVEYTFDILSTDNILLYDVLKNQDYQYLSDILEIPTIKKLIKLIENSKEYKEFISQIDKVNEKFIKFQEKYNISNLNRNSDPKILYSQYLVDKSEL